MDGQSKIGEKNVSAKIRHSHFSNLKLAICFDMKLIMLIWIIYQRRVRAIFRELVSDL